MTRLVLVVWLLAAGGQVLRWVLARFGKACRRLVLSGFIVAASLVVGAGTASAEHGINCSFEYGGVQEVHPDPCPARQEVRLQVWNGTAWVPWSGQPPGFVTVQGNVGVANAGASSLLVRPTADEFTVTPASGSSWGSVEATEVAITNIPDWAEEIDSRTIAALLGFGGLALGFTIWRTIGGRA